AVAEHPGVESPIVDPDVVRRCPADLDPGLLEQASNDLLSVIEILVLHARGQYALGMVHARGRCMSERELRIAIRRDLPAWLFRPRPWRALWAVPMVAVIAAGTWAVI